MLRDWYYVVANSSYDNTCIVYYYCHGWSIPVVILSVIQRTLIAKVCIQ